MTDLNDDRRYAGETGDDDTMPEHEFRGGGTVGGGLMGEGGTAVDRGAGARGEPDGLDQDEAALAPSDEHGLVDVPGDDLTDGLAPR